ncbi:MAG: hypothetical protein ACYDBB_23855 [Armatimonadota bacterium]
MARVSADVAAAGITHYGITDHLNSVMSLPWLATGRQDFDTLPFSPNRYFGVEVTCLREYDLWMNEEAGDNGIIWGKWPDGPVSPITIYLPPGLIDQLGISYVVGGAHWPLNCTEPQAPEAVIRSYHEQNLFLATHPLVDIVAHPWWWMGAWQDADYQYRSYPWLDDFRRIPLSMHDEFAAAAVQHGTAVEISAGAILLNPFYPSTFRQQYLDYLAYLKERGVSFSLATDSHAPDYYACLGEIEDDLDWLGLREEELWRPAGMAKII